MNPTIKKYSQPSYDYSMKLIIIGDSGVGKSSLLYRYQQDKFTQNYIMTIGMNYVWKIQTIDHVKIKLQIWDTAGQERYKTITQNYYKNSDGAIIGFSIDSLQSFYSVRNWIGELNEAVQTNIQVLLVGTKCDLSDQRQVDRKQAEQFAKQNNIQYMECSAKSGQSVNDVFIKLTSMMKHNVIDMKLRQSEEKEKQKDKQNQGKLSLFGRKIVNSNRCCK